MIKVIVISKTPHTVLQWSQVTNIAISGGNYVITDNGTTHSYSMNDFIIQILV